MHPVPIISIATLLLFSCNTPKQPDHSTAKEATQRLERLLPETKGVEIFDTLISSQQLQITITKADLDSYVTNEYEEDGFLKVDQYRDLEIGLTIQQNRKVILDTTFRKEQFAQFAEEGFMDIASFHNYWIDSLDNHTIKFWGVIIKPETDWTFAFHHYFDLTTQKLTFEPDVSEEE